MKKKSSNWDLNSGKEEIIAAMQQFEEKHQKFLPKVDRRFVIDLFLRLREKPDEKPMYTIETWVEEGNIRKRLEIRLDR